jgi:hypothetical protein
MMEKFPITIRAVLFYKGSVKTYKEGTPGEFCKCTITLYTVDDQKLYVELRNSNISMLDVIPEGTIVDVDIIFLGSEKNDKRYNNLIATKIKKV